MIIIKFLGLLALGMFLVCIVIATKNAMDTLITQHFVQTKVRKALVENLYIIMKTNEQMKKDLMVAGLKEEDAEEYLAYLRDIPRHKIEEEFHGLYGNEVPLDLDMILGKDDKDE